MNDIVNGDHENCHFVAYGYGKRAEKDADHNEGHNIYLSSRRRAAINMISFKAIGREIVGPSLSGDRAIRALIATIDVIHIHVLHSYFAPLAFWSQLLSEFRGRIVVTTHDFWWLTGRCASPLGCLGYQTGCGVCPTLGNYPPVWLDNSSRGWHEKRAFINSIFKKATFVSPSKFVADIHSDALTAARCTFIRNGISSHFDFEMYSEPPKESPNFRVVVVASDLSDPEKVDPAVLSELRACGRVELVAIGRNGTAFRSGEWMGEFKEKSDIARELAKSDLLLFTSVKDTCGLVVMEALACGLLICGVESDALNELLAVVGDEIVRPHELLGPDGNRSPLILQRLTYDARLRRARVSRTNFGLDEMISSYRLLYGGILQTR